MEKQLEFFDTIANQQKLFINNVIGIQQDLRTQWLGSLSKLQDAIASNLPETPQTKESLSLFNSWYSKALSSTQSASEEALKTQENWIAAYDKQVAINREAFKSLLDLAKPAGKAKAA